MNVYLNIEKLITYAKIHLLLDQADEIYVRNALMQKLGLEAYEAYEVDEDEIEAYSNPSELVGNLFAYALEKGICKEEDKRLFAAEVMDIVSLRPGEMEDMFESLSKNPSRALEWAFDYAVKNGSTTTAFRRWENKGYNLDVVFADCCGGKGAYPGCCRCLEGEGYGVHRNERYIELTHLGDWYYKAAKQAYFYGMGNIISAEHTPLVIDEKTLGVMFDFVESAPNMYILTGESEETARHAHFVCGTQLLPIHKAGEKCKYKNKVYPYINISQTDWYLSTVKLACTNREKLIEFVLKLINSFKESNKGRVFVSLRRVESKFVIELGFAAGEPKKEHLAISQLDVMAMAGVFKISRITELRLKEIERYLTKEVRFTPACLTNGMEVHAKMIDALLKSTGTAALGAVEAALDVKEECKKNLVAMLNEVSAFKGDMADFVQ